MRHLAATVVTVALGIGSAFYTVPDVIHEDDPRWDCTTMGNRICGVQLVDHDGSDVGGRRVLVMHDDDGQPTHACIIDTNAELQPNTDGSYGPRCLPYFEGTQAEQDLHDEWVSQIGR